MGKTALATNIAFNVAKAYAKRANPDGTQKTVDGGGRRLLLAGNVGGAARHPHHLAEQSGVPSWKIRRGDITEPRSSTKIVARRARCSRSRFYIDDTTGGITIAPARTRARRLKRQRGLGLIVVDYLQLLSARRRRARTGCRKSDRDHHAA
jgi:replicative DNA helicase